MTHYAHSRQIPVVATLDVFVAGGGLAGICAAVSAAQAGMKVLLVEQFADLGGAATISGVSGFCGHTAGVGRPFDQIIGRLADAGLIDEYRPEQDGRAFESVHAAYVMMDYVLAQGVEVLLHTSVVDAVRDGDRIDPVIIHTSGGLGAVCPKIVVDATGDADLVQAAGFPTESGTDEDPESRLPMSLCFSMWDTREKQTPWLPEGCPRYAAETVPMTSISRKAGGRIDVKMKVIRHSAVDGRGLSDAEIEARRQMMGVIYFLQTEGYGGKRYDTYRLSSVAPHIGVREGRRIVGEARLTTDDVRSGRRWPDAVAVGTYHIDYHWPDLLQRAGTGITDGAPTYHIPLRALIPKGARNVLVAGRCASGEQLAMSSFRVMATAEAMGHAAGLCAAMAAKAGLAPGEVDVPALQSALVASGAVLDPDWHAVYQASRRPQRPGW